MPLADCRRHLFNCKMIYQSSSAVAIIGRPPPTFPAAVPVVWNAFQEREMTLLLIPNSAATLVTVRLLLQLSDDSSTCEVVQVISSSYISQTDSLALAANMLNCVFVLHFILLLSSVRRHHEFCVPSRRF
ncbi:hypothetical protein TNCV_2457241 [Trichonephila clavipes]|nr:hypothetical protein TNCV_2457241 [Trichonephila clavipes]